MSSPHSSARLVLLGLHSTGRLARNRLLPVLLAAAQQLQVSSPASQRLLRDSLKASGVLLVNGLSPNERRLLRLNDLVAGLNALRSTEKNRKVSVGVAASFALCDQWWKNSRTASRAFWAQSWTS
jgi:hypothetical protein